MLFTVETGRGTFRFLESSERPEERMRVYGPGDGTGGRLPGRLG